MTLEDWTYDKTISAARTINIVYTIKNANDQYERKIAKLTSTQWSETLTTFQYIEYISERWTENGREYCKIDGQWVTAIKETWTRDTIASINGSLVKWSLENGHGLPSGDIYKYSRTEYKYLVFEGDGPQLYTEYTREEIDFLELLGSLNISDYGPINGESLSAGSYLVSQETRVQHDWWQGNKTIDLYNGIRTWRDYTRTKTSRWLAYGLTQEGQQAASEMLRQEDGTGNPTWEVIDSALNLKFDGTETRTSTGRLQVAGRPSDEEIAQDDIKAGDGDVDPDEVGSGDVYSSEDYGKGDPGDASSGFDFGSDDFNWQDYTGVDPDTGVPEWANLVDGDWQDYNQDSNNDGTPDWVDELPSGGGGGGGGGTSSVAQYDMPFPPDDYYGPNGQLVAGNAAQAAKKYGETINALKAANSFGFNVTTAVQKVSTQPLAPLYLNAGGLRVQTRMNGTAWAFGNMGIVVSSDLLLAGVVARTA
jgi:hypothetical protein